MNLYGLYDYSSMAFVLYTFLYFIVFQKHRSNQEVGNLNDTYLVEIDAANMNTRSEHFANCNKLIHDGFLAMLTSSEFVETWEVDFCASFIRGIRTGSTLHNKESIDDVFIHALCVFRGNFSRVNDLYANKTFYSNVKIDQAFIHNCLDLEVHALHDFFMSIVYRNTRSMTMINGNSLKCA